MNVKKCVRALLCLYLTLIIAMDAVKAQALKVGDTLPPELWSMPLQVINHPEGKETITLNAYKDKLIILDFWATWCGACIKSLAKLDTLQKEFKEQLAVVPITYEVGEKVLPFLTKRGYELPSVVGDTMVKQYFPHRSIPHQVWVRAGEVLAVTGAEYATIENISTTLAGKPLSIKQKNEDTNFDQNKPLLIEGNGGGVESLLYQSVFSKRINARIGGSVTNPKSFMVFNTDVRLMYWYAYSDLIPWDGRQNRILFEIDSVSRASLDFMYYAQNSPSEDAIDLWLNQNTFCYSLTLPTPTKRDKIQEITKEETNRFLSAYLGISGRIEKRKVPSLQISRSNISSPAEAGVNAKRTSLWHFYQSVAYVNSSLALPVVIDVPEAESRDTMLEHDKDIDLKDMEAVRTVLLRHGFSITEREVNLDILIIKAAEL